ncbi:MAG: hypothetical protein E6868_19445 [Pantoea sp.]|uniref:hypothetical protein n=1 Tax=Pantoea sp. TaxID=69393 RepID=UPI0028FF1111|nr:hypothetical protein [Pantoea sp.]MDU1575414.1 hypothetical protein [Pantoea sp.]
MSLHEPSDLQILQRRVGAAEVLLALVCEHLTSEQKEAIQARIDDQLKVWEGENEAGHIFKGASSLLKRKI